MNVGTLSVAWIIRAIRVKKGRPTRHPKHYFFWWVSKSLNWLPFDLHQSYKIQKINCMCTSRSWGKLLPKLWVTLWGKLELSKMERSYLISIGTKDQLFKGGLKIRKGACGTSATVQWVHFGWEGGYCCTP